MDNMKMPTGVTPMPSTTIARFMAVYDELCPTVDDEALVARAVRLAEGLDRSIATVEEARRLLGLASPP